MAIGESLTCLLSGLGDAGVLLGVLLVFLIDALMVPALPEVFFIGAYTTHPDPLFGILLLTASFIGEASGILALYAAVRRAGPGGRVKRLVERYSGMLPTKDERSVLLNRIIPVIPFCGAFIALSDWDVRRCSAYIAIGFFAKYGFLLLFSSEMHSVYGSGTASAASLALAAALVSIGLAASLMRRNGRLHAGRSRSQRCQRHNVHTVRTSVRIGCQAADHAQQRRRTAVLGEEP